MIMESLAQRRSYYTINKNLPITKVQLVETIEHITELVPDAFNMKSARVVIVLGTKHDQLWDVIYDAFDGKVSKAKIDSFKVGAGTILYFYDESVVAELQAKFPLYAANFPIWANQANGMLQICLWSALRELGLGASLQHYNPIIDAAVHQLFDLPENYLLLAQMPFGGIVEEPSTKEKENIKQRVAVFS